nr:MAG TPA: hypothetical protein [Caudoviricetes sp.]
MPILKICRSLFIDKCIRLPFLSICFALRSDNCLIV